METIKNFAKHTIVTLAVLGLGLFYTVLVAIGMFVKSLYKGKDYWYIKDRTLPPLILQDPAWGRHSHVSLKDVKIHYVENGDRNKPLMLFVHGFPEFWFCWRHQLKYFAKNYWVVAIDMRGYGDSDKPPKVSDYKTKLIVKDVVDVVKALQKDRCILVGHDWGGFICWDVAANYPEIVEKLVILNAPHPSTYKKKMESSIKQFLKSWYVFTFQIPRMPEIYFRTQDLEVFRDLFENKLTEEELEAYKYNWGRKGAFTPPINYYRNAMNASDILNPPKFPIITCPTQIIWGENDVALYIELPYLAKPHVKNLEIQIIPGATHFVQTDQPDKVNELMEKFVGL